MNLLPLFGETSPIFTIAKRVQSKYFKLDLVSQFSTNSIFFKFHKVPPLRNLQCVSRAIPLWGKYQSSTIFSWVSLAIEVFTIFDYLGGWWISTGGVFFDWKRVLCRFQRVSGTNEEIKRSWRPSLLWSRNRSSTILDHSIILQPCRSCFYDPVGPRSTIMRWVSPRSYVGSLHDRVSTIVRWVCPRSIGLLQVCYRSVTVFTNSHTLNTTTGPIQSIKEEDHGDHSTVWFNVSYIVCVVDWVYLFMYPQWA